MSYKPDFNTSERDVAQMTVPTQAEAALTSVTGSGIDFNAGKE